VSDDGNGCLALVVLFAIIIGSLVVGAIIYTKFIDPPPVTSAVQGILDSCQQTWYTKSATWEGLNGTLVLECKE